MYSKLILFLMVLLFLIACNSCNDQIIPPEDDNVKVVWSFYRDYNFNVVDIMKPLIVGNKVYIVHDHHLSCRNLSDGKEIWKVDIGNTNSIDSRKLLFSNNSLLFNWLHRVYSYNANDGKLNWKTVISNFDARPLKYPTQNSTHLFIPGTYSQYAKIDKVTGHVDLIKFVHELKPDSIDQSIGAMQVTDDGFLYVPTGYFRKNYIGAIEGNLLCYSSITDEFIWGFKVPNHKIFLPGRKDSSYTDAGVSECSVYGDYVAFQAGSSVFLLKRFSGEVIWEKFFEHDGFFSNGILIYEDKVYASATSGNLYCLSVTNGEVLWSVDTRYTLITLLNLYGNRLYFCNDGGSGIWVIDKDSGKVIWNGEPPENSRDDHYSFFSPVETNGEYMVNVGTRKVYCLTVPK